MDSQLDKIRDRLRYAASAVRDAQDISKRIDLKVPDLDRVEQLLKQLVAEACARSIRGSTPQLTPRHPLLTISRACHLGPDRQTAAFYLEMLDELTQASEDVGVALRIADDECIEFEHLATVGNLLEDVVSHVSALAEEVLE